MLAKLMTRYKRPNGPDFMAKMIVIKLVDEISIPTRYPLPKIPSNKENCGNAKYTYQFRNRATSTPIIIVSVRFLDAKMNK